MEPRSTGCGAPVPPRVLPTTPQELVRWVPAGHELPLISQVEVQAFSADAWGNVKVCRKVTRGTFVMPRGYVASDLVAVVLEAPASENGRFGSDRVTDRGRPGSFSLLPAGMPYTYQCDGVREVLHVSLAAPIDDEQEGAGGVELRPLFAAADPLVTQIAMALLHDCATGIGGGRLYGEALGVALEAHLTHRYGAAGPVPAACPAVMATSQLRRVIDFIEAHLERDLRISDLARVAAMSRSRFVQEFRRTTGQSPHGYLTERRVERAKRLLASRELQIHEIAARCGYADQTSFTRAFRRVTRMTPRVYRTAAS